MSLFRSTCSCFMKIDPTHTYHSSLIFSHVKSSISISISICIMHICPHFISIGRTIVLFTLHHSLAYVPVFVIGDTGLIIFFTHLCILILPRILFLPCVVLFLFLFCFCARTTQLHNRCHCHDILFTPNTQWSTFFYQRLCISRHIVFFSPVILLYLVWPGYALTPSIQCANERTYTFTFT